MTTTGHLGTGLMLVLLTLGAGCADHVDAGASNEAAPTPAASSATPAEPTSRPANRGVRVAVPSHCGVLSLTVSGHLWLADPPLGDHNPPPGWDENETPGFFLRTGPGRAVLETDGGQSASFRLAPSGATDPNDGCE